ncbi:MAG TPA: metallophosphoesterase [Acidimicrobiia bacterium]|jgi:3',5'-cyclic AMP phosphodiesterase CpdA|nr:metallophosphoesterase [Acidimicrobiia bacterium]
MNPDDAFNAELSRRRFLRHAAWAGAAVAVTVSGGVVTSKVLAHPGPAPKAEDFTFVQISDSHIGFTGAANPDVTKTFQSALDVVNALPARPDLVVHTGDLTHFSTNEQFDQVKQMLSTLRTGQVLVLPGEHDSTDDTGQKYRQFFGAGSQGDGWFSFDHRGVHFVALVNTINLQKLGHLGADQLAWLEGDLKRVSSETPLVVFSHIPLFAMYPDWGWGTDDSTTALGFMRRFGSVTVLNGHVHQLMTKVEGNITFHTAAPTAYPLPHPGNGPAPKPVVVAADQLHQALGIRQAHLVAGHHGLAVTDQELP